MKTIISTFVCIALVTTMFAQQTPSGSSDTCGPISGKTQKDLENVRTFCEEGIVKGAAVGAYAMESLLWVKVSREMANAMRSDRLSAEQLVLTWMKGWRQISGHRSVNVYVEWKDVEIAEGDTTVFSGDVVTIN